MALCVTAGTGTIPDKGVANLNQVGAQQARPEPDGFGTDFVVRTGEERRCPKDRGGSWEGQPAHHTS